MIYSLSTALDEFAAGPTAIIFDTSEAEAAGGFDESSGILEVRRRIWFTCSAAWHEHSALEHYD
jgi:hypothetical protein